MRLTSFLSCLLFCLLWVVRFYRPAFGNNDTNGINLTAAKDYSVGLFHGWNLRRRIGASSGLFDLFFEEQQRTYRKRGFAGIVTSKPVIQVK